MHSIVILIVLAIVWWIRQAEIRIDQTWNERWRHALFLLLFPPLLLLTTAIVIVCMGSKGAMLGIEASWLGYGVAVGFIIFAGWSGLHLAYRGYLTVRRLSTYEPIEIEQKTARILELDFPYCAQIGFWNSRLVVSRGLLTRLNPERLAAVLAHEQAHAYYRDTFWFFWLGWLRSITAWLPQTELLWQEILLLRELRADRKAIEQVEPLLLAESLLSIAKAPLELPGMPCLDFSSPAVGDRLKERIDFLLVETEPIPATTWRSWNWISWLLLPWLTIPLHY